MAIRYTRQGSVLYIEPLGDITATAGPDVVKRINLQTFGQIRSATLVINGATLASGGTLYATIGTTTSGGTEYTLQTLTLAAVASAGGDYVLEIPAELIAHFADRNSMVPKSLAFKINVDNSDTYQAALIVECLHDYVDHTPSDDTSVA